jgi:hypothetical protein
MNTCTITAQKSWPVNYWIDYLLTTMNTWHDV